MGSNDASVIVALAHAGRCEDDRVGGKARNLGRLIEAGYRVPAGFDQTPQPTRASSNPPGWPR